MRRQSDKTNARLYYLLLALNAALAVLACVIGYKALVALDAFQSGMESVRAASEIRRRATPMPGDY